MMDFSNMQENNSLHNTFNLMKQQNVYEAQKYLNGKKEKLNDKRFDEHIEPEEQKYLNGKSSNDRFQLSASMENINWDYTKELKKYSDFLSISLLNDLDYKETFRQNDCQNYELFDRTSCSQLTFPKVIRKEKAKTVCTERNVNENVSHSRKKDIFFVNNDNREKVLSMDDKPKMITDQEESAIDCESPFQPIEHVNNNWDSKTTLQRKICIDLTLPQYTNESNIDLEKNLQEKRNSKYSFIANENICMAQSTIASSSNGVISTDNSTSSTSTSNVHSTRIVPPKCLKKNYEYRSITNKYQLCQNVTSNSHHDKNVQSPTLLLNSKKGLKNTENSLKSENHINKVYSDMGINGASSTFTIPDTQKPNLDSKNFPKYQKTAILGRHLNNYQQRPICVRTPHHEYNVSNSKNRCSCIDGHNHNHIGGYNSIEISKLGRPCQTTILPPVSSSSLPNSRSPYFLSPNYSQFRFC